MEKTTYLTTSIAYVNADPHIGFLLELVSTDVLARYYRLLDKDTFFVTGTDEHGSKVAKKAEAEGIIPKVFVDKISEKYRKTCHDFLISNDFFIRTTDEKHIDFVRDSWKKVAEKGLLEKRKYKGLYCVGCEEFKREKDLVDGLCPIHKTKPEVTEEENWFFKLSEFKDDILNWLKKPDTVTPPSRALEVINFIESGLEDISVSRSIEQLKWGIPIPDDDTQVMYVWFDALLNYLSAILAAGKKIEDVWPADIQNVGKDIFRFHSVIWPGILLALDLELPNKILVHGFIQSDGQKMSKSLGNVISPNDLKAKYGAEATRYLILRQLSFYDDSDFSWKNFDEIYNGELANGFGNLLSRVIGLLQKKEEKDENLKEVNKKYILEEDKKAKNLFITDNRLEKADFVGELNKINELLNNANNWISENKPWTKLDENAEEFSKNLIKNSNLIEISYRLEPFLPNSSKSIREQLSNLKLDSLFPRL